MPSPTASPTCARRSTPWKRSASAASRSTGSASARSTRCTPRAVDPRLSSLVLINLPLFTVPTANVLGQLEQRGHSASEYLGKLARPGSWGNLLRGRSNLAALTRGGGVPPADEHDRPADGRLARRRRPAVRPELRASGDGDAVAARRPHALSLLDRAGGHRGVRRRVRRRRRGPCGLSRRGDAGRARHGPLPHHHLGPGAGRDHDGRVRDGRPEGRPRAPARRELYRGYPENMSRTVPLST